MILDRRNKLFSRFFGITAFMTGFAFFRHEVNKSESKTSEAKVFEGSKLLIFVDETQEASLVIETESELPAISAETGTQEILSYESSYSASIFSGQEGVDFYYGDFLFEEALYIDYGEEEEALILANVFVSLLPSPPNFIVENRDGEEIVSAIPDVVIALPLPDSPLAEEEDIGETASAAFDIEEPLPDSPLVESENIDMTVSAPVDISPTPPDFHMAEGESMDETAFANPNAEQDDDNNEPPPEPVVDKCSLATTHCISEYSKKTFLPSRYSDSVTDIHLERKSVLAVNLRDFGSEFLDYNYSGEGTIKFTNSRFNVNDIDFSKISSSLRLETSDGVVITPPEQMDLSSEMSYDSLTDLASMYTSMEDFIL